MMLEQVQEWSCMRTGVLRHACRIKESTRGYLEYNISSVLIHDEYSWHCLFINTQQVLQWIKQGK
jgi:hypothetical protein